MALSADKRMEESRAEFDKRMKESDEDFDKQMKESRTEFDKRMKASNEDFDKQMKESRAEFDKRMKESDEKFYNRMKNLDEMIGGLGNSNGMFAEEFFFNAIDHGDKKMFGEQFYECLSSSKRYSKSNRKKNEQDVLLINGDALALIEVKYKARKEDIQKIIDRLPNFRALFPEYRQHRIFLGLAAMSFDRGVEDESAKAGIAIVKQVGDTIVINDEHLRTF